MRYGILIASMLGLWLFLWSLNFASQRHTGQPFQWPAFSLGNLLVMAAFYAPPFVAAGLAVSVRKSEMAEFIFLMLARLVVVIVVLFVAFMIFLNAIVR